MMAQMAQMGMVPMGPGGMMGPMSQMNPLMNQQQSGGMNQLSSSQSQQQSNSSSTKGDYPLFVLYLPTSVTEADLKELFELYGPVNKATICFDKETGNPKG